MATTPSDTSDPRASLLGRTWELELLISGALVFGLLQLPGRVDRVFAVWESSRALPAPSRDRRRVLDCLGSLWRVSLGATLLENLELRFYEHPQSEVPGVVAFLPTAPLAPGERPACFDVETGSG